MTETPRPMRLAWSDVWPSERARIIRRRQAHGLPSEVNSPSETVCLALSGGGIRSATFSLGFMRALARARMLECADYLSTVSGGGYAGSFFVSLFARRPKGTTPGPAQAFGPEMAAPGPAQPTPYDFMRGPVCRPDESPHGVAPLGWPYWWLRNSGRYLAPTGAGDYLYAAALGLRNLIAVHYVIGLTLLMVACLALVIDGLVRQLPGLSTLTWLVKHPGSGWVLLAGAVAIGLLLPLGLAYFLTEMPARQRTGKAPWWHTRTWRRVNLATLAALLVSGLALPSLARQLSQWLPALQGFAELLGGVYGGSLKWSVVFGFLAGFVWLALGMLSAAARYVDKGHHLPGVRTGTEAVAPQGMMLATRVELTKRLAGALEWTLALMGVAVVLYAANRALGLSREILGAGGLSAAALVALVRKAAPWLSKRLGDNNATKMPLEPLLLALGFTLAGLVCVIWFMVARWIVGAESAVGLPSDLPSIVTAAAALLAALAPLAWLNGKSFQFINLSSIQNLYSSRLVRAYLGASNPARAEDKGSRWIRISDTHPDDNLLLDTYYGSRNGQPQAPLHVINVTVNETVSPSDPLVQRDRHGRPMALSPDHLNVDGVWYQLASLQPIEESGSLVGRMRDGFIRAWRSLISESATAAGDAKAAGAATTAEAGAPAGHVTSAGGAVASPATFGKRDAPEAMSVGSWVGISGAAFSTGLGRGTSIGKSLLLGLANVRLGHWWHAGVLGQVDEQTGLLAKFTRWLAGHFQTQSYLLAELLGRFSGRYAPYWYLSDGGHHENTAVYEALRRRVGVVLCTDCGADPTYAWEDLANLIRLTRIELGCEFQEIVAEQPREESLLIIKGRGARDRALEQLAALMLWSEAKGRGQFADGGCLRMFWVTYPTGPSGGNSGDGTLLLLVKPRLVTALPVDLHEYARQSPSFPQETTVDQFFSEAQWESYRALGEGLGERLAAALASAAGTPADSGGPAAMRNALMHLRARVAQANGVWARMEQREDLPMPT